jgi:hypothetical protein
MKRLTSFLLCAFVSVIASNAANIYWVSFHPGDNTPSAAAATAGFTNAPDIGYTRLLRNSGHTVTRVVSSGTPNTNLLNAADLVIISRSVPSGDYQDNPETAAWNGITAPTIIMGGYVLRNSRLGYTTGATIPDTTNTVSLTALVPGHAIFAGIPLDGANTMVNPYASIVTFTNTQRGISVNTDPVAGGGTVLATISSAGAPPGGMIIGEWQAGAIMGDAAPTDTLGGHRLVFLSGSREQVITSEGAGIYDLNPDGAKLFLNAVDYMSGTKVITVNTTNPVAGAGETNLFAAISQLQDGAIIRFNISGSGPHYIQTPAGGYPLITNDNVTIAGYSQPGAVPNSNPILSSNNAAIKIVLDSRNGNSKIMDFPGDTPNDDTGYGSGESAILGILEATNVSIRGVCLLAVPLTGPAGDVALYGVSFAKGANGRVNGCWIGTDVTGQTATGIAPADGITGFRYRGRDEANVVTNTILVSGVTVGVTRNSGNPRAEFNVITGVPAIPIIIEGADTRIAGNFLGVLPGGNQDYNVALDPVLTGNFEGFIEIGRAGNNTIIGTDGDGVNDAEERNIFGGTMPPGLGGYDHTIEFYGQTPGTNIIVAGNYIGVGVDGTTRFTNGVPPLNAAGGAAKFRFGSDVNGVSDALEGNVVFNNWPQDLFGPTSPDFQQNFFDELADSGSVSLRANRLVNNFTPPVNPLRTAGAHLTNYYTRVLADINTGVSPALSTNSTVARLLGTAPLPSAAYPVVIVDLYIADPEGITNGIAAGIPELPNGFIQGRTYLGSFVVDGAADLNPAAGAFEFNIASLNVPLNTQLTVTANYQAAGGPSSPTITSLFAVPVAAKAVPAVITIGSATRSGSTLTLGWTGGSPPYQVQTRANLSGATWANDPTAVITGTSATLTISGNEGYFRIQGQ